MAADGMDRCFAEVSAASGGTMDHEATLAMLSFIDDRAERLSRDGGMAPADAARKAAEDAAKMEAASAVRAKANASLNLQKRLARREMIGQVAARVGKDGKLDLAHAMMNQVVARNAPARGARLSAEAVWKTLKENYHGAVVIGLKQSNLLKAFRNGTMERDWARELYELSMKAAGEESHVGTTGNAAALKVAEVVHGVQQLAKTRLNREGAWIGDYAGYITSTTHNADKIRRAGFDAWRDFIAPRLSEETFEGGNTGQRSFRDTMLREVWASLVDGVHLTDHGPIGDKDPAFSGPANMAKKLSQGRSLHFKNADAWLDYQQKFGTGSLAEQTMGALDRSARQTSLMQRWGTNPEAEFQNDFRAMQEKYRDSHLDASVGLGQARNAIQKRFDYLTGQANKPINQQAAQIASSIRAIGSMAHLGGVALTHLSSFPTKAAELRYNGIGWLERYSNSIESLLQGRGRGEAGELADLMLAGTEGMHGSMLSKFNGDDGVTGRVGKAANTFFKWSGLTYMLDAQKSGMQRVMSRLLGRNVETEFTGLTPEIQRMLTNYDISPAEWDTLRTAPDHVTVDGRVHLTPDAAERAGLIGGAADRLGLKLHALYSDIADRGIITPGIDDKALLLANTSPGSLGGEALRFIAQFKTWGVAAARQGLGREVYGGQGYAGAASGLVQLALGAAVMGYTTMALKQLAAGQIPRNPLDPSTVFASLIQGGGFGIVGDFLFGEFNRFGRTAVETLAGPTAGTASDLIQLFSTLRGVATRDPNARAKDILPDIARFAQSNTPFINMFYAKRALDYLFLHSLQESMNPGYLARSQRTLQRNTGQQFWLSPQNHLKPFGR